MKYLLYIRTAVVGSGVTMIYREEHTIFKS